MLNNLYSVFSNQYSVSVNQLPLTVGTEIDHSGQQNYLLASNTTTERLGYCRKRRSPFSTAIVSCTGNAENNE